MTEKIAVLEVSGGIGKSIMASAVCEAIKKRHSDRKLLVFSSWIEPLLHNPFIDRVYKTGSTPYIYDDMLKGNDVLFLCQEPYRSHGYLSESKSLIESWCEEINIPYNGEKPYIYMTPREEAQISSVYARQKPILLIQPFGGMSKRFPYSWNRDIPQHQAQSLVDVLSQQYHVIQIGLQDQPKLNNAEFINAPVRDLFVLIKNSHSRIFIDSFAQHAAAAFEKPSVVCWVTNKPNVFGYKIHANVEANWSNSVNNIHYIDGSFQKFDFGGSRLYDYPFKDHNVFDLRMIIDALRATASVS